MDLQIDDFKQDFNKEQLIDYITKQLKNYPEDDQLHLSFSRKETKCIIVALRENQK